MFASTGPASRPDAQATELIFHQRFSQTPVSSAQPPLKMGSARGSQPCAGTSVLIIVDPSPFFSLVSGAVWIMEAVNGDRWIPRAQTTRRKATMKLALLFAAALMTAAPVTGILASSDDMYYGHPSAHERPEHSEHEDAANDQREDDDEDENDARRNEHHGHDDEAHEEHAREDREGGEHDD
jgi:hypothetical protein